MADAIASFFGADAKNWHLGGIRRKQSETIQILASGSKQRPCLLIYDDGEGQAPDDFEKTFLSLLRGNKNDIPFVQGKYNMGGTGALVFCGRNHYQLIGSRRFDNSSDFGYTLIRKHPLTAEEAKTRKNTWYEYLKIDGQIPRFPVSELDLGLLNRKFTTGTVIKLYDYDLPAGTRGALPQEPRRAIDHFLFEPALPVLLVDSKERYPNNKVLELDCFGLKRRLESEDNKYLETKFSIEEVDHDIGKLKITCYVFKALVEGRSARETRDIIDREFFHDDMAILFSLNGQVHGHFTSEFITRALKMPLLKHHLLIHVDCTALNYDFRHELFMASRDRLKAGDDTTELRKRVASALLKSELAEIYKERKTAISVEGGDAKDLLRAFSKNLPFNKDLMKLLNQTFKIEQQDKGKLDDSKKEAKSIKAKEPFNPKRYPSFFRMKSGKGEQMLSMPAGDEKTIQFATDVEDSYFDRSDDPGELRVSILQVRHNETSGGTEPGKIGDPTKVLDIRKSSPRDGTIRVIFGATSELRAGHEVEIQATLGGPEDIEQRFWIKIVEPQAKPKEIEKKEDAEEPPLGLPDYVLVYDAAPDGNANATTWGKLGESSIEMDFGVVMHPYLNGDGHLEKVFINMDSAVLRNYVSRQGAISVEAKETAEKKYISSVYFHTIFLFSISKNKNYAVKQGEKDVDLSDYLKDVFSSYYSEFLLNFGAEQLMASLED